MSPDMQQLLANDPYNERRIFVLSCLHDAIYFLRHGPDRRNDVISSLQEEVLGAISIGISSAVVEHDVLFERLCRNLELTVPIALRTLRRHNDRESDEDVADDLISCIPTTLQQPDQWDPQVEEISDEERFEQEEHNRRRRLHR
ncbi:hypothetical protein N7516_004655 [Penicillium verrucosum]|uniref:uncharacterized protein n=1 Tax=Penicillium verrucosum TaxID=60171 RepID=UPI002545A4D6|nr:uncharacterized protein N7516_004655 [Penicillium verrucosum]KAJ5944487.1 hypothetical protein N7516_004655 [Penicillium verrucosum]